METRVQKFKNYRASFVKEDTNVTRSDYKRYTTNTLPLDEVMNTASTHQNDVDLVNKKKKEFVLKVVGIVCLCIIAIAAIVTCGVLLFR